MSKTFNFIKKRALNYPNRLAIRQDKEVINYADLINKTIELSEHIQSKNIKRIALLEDNSINWILLDLACQISGTTLVPLPKFFTNEHLKKIIQLTNIEYLVTRNTSYIESLIEEDVQLDQTFNILKWFKNNHVSKNSKIKDKSPENTQKITFTSGSTNEPKGVCLNEEAQYIVAKSVFSVTKNIESKKHLCVMPFTTLLENIAGIYVPLMRGNLIIIEKPSSLGFKDVFLNDLDLFLERISSLEPSSMIVPPEILRLMVSAAKGGWRPPLSLTFLTVGGSKVSGSLIREARSYNINAFEGYGLSESASVVSLNLPDDNKIGLQGKLLPHVQIKISNGELYIKNIGFLGYLDDYLKKQETAEEWINSGDLATFDKTKNLKIIGRKKNLIISSYGRNISPEWVETELSNSEYIKNAVLIGNHKPFCVALIIPEKSHINTSLKLKDEIDRVNQHLPGFAQIKKWKILDNDFPRNLFRNHFIPNRKEISRFYSKEINALYCIG